MRIVAVGFSSVEDNAAWAASLDYEYEVWADTERVLGQHYGVLSEHDSAPLRHAYVLDEAGQALLFHQGGVSLGAFPDQVLADCEALFGD